MAYETDEKQRRKKTMLNDWRQPHPATLKPLDGGKYPCTAIWEQKISGTFPIVLKFNDGVYNKDAKTNHKELEMDYRMRGKLFQALIEACEDPNFDTKQIVFQKPQFIRVGGASKLSENPIVQGMFTISRKDGVIGMTYTKGDFKVPIVFGGDYDVVYVKNAEGEKVEDRGLMSRWSCKAWIEFHRKRLDTIEESAWEPPKPKGDTGGGGGGNRNGNGGSGGGGGGRSNFDDFEDPEF